MHDGVGGTELGRGIGSLGACKLNDANVCVPCCGWEKWEIHLPTKRRECEDR